MVAPHDDLIISEKEQAAQTMQRYFRGMMTRRTVKQKYGFECNTLSSKGYAKYDQTDDQVKEARRLVL